MVLQVRKKFITIPAQIYLQQLIYQTAEVYLHYRIACQDSLKK